MSKHGIGSFDRKAMSRRVLLRALGTASVGMPLVGVFTGRAVSAQGRCMTTYGSPACNTADVPAPFEPTGWTTTALDHVTFQVADYRAEAAFYIALMGWTLRTDDGQQAVLDIGDWGTVVLKRAQPGVLEAAAAGGGRNGASRAFVESFGFAIDRWNATTVEAALAARGLAPVAHHDGQGFESFLVKDPDGFTLQIGNGLGHTRTRRTPSSARLPTPAPFEPTGWKTVWLDHLSFSVTNYKKSVAFYGNLLGWKTTYDEGSQNELMVSEIGDVIIRGGNPLDPKFGQGPQRRPGIDHISFGIQPWDTDGVKAALETRGLKAQIDTSSKHKAPDGTWVADDIHTAEFKSYHTDTPNGYNLQLSYVTHDNRLALANAVNPKRISGK